MNRMLAPIALTASLLTAAGNLPARAQDNGSQPAKGMSAQERADHFINDSVDREYKLHYVTTGADGNEFLVAVRNLVKPETKVFLVPSKQMIAVHAPEDVQAQIAKLLAALDSPQSRYRLTYTLTELDGPKKIGVQHFSMVVLSGNRSQMKQGSRLPITTHDGPQYIDVGVNFDATLSAIEGGGVLKNKVEQTSIAPDSTSPSNPNPVLRQTELEGTTALTLNKPQMVGTLDVPSSTHHFDVEVVMEPVN